MMGNTTIMPMSYSIKHSELIQREFRNQCATSYGGEGGIRTPGPLRVNGFQDRRDRPLRHLSKVEKPIDYFMRPV